VLYGERIYVGYRWYDTTARDVAFPFGFGLSYSTFDYSDPRVTLDDPAVAHVDVEVTVTNTGTRAGATYSCTTSDPAPSQVDRPARELRAFKKVYLAAGESTTVRFELDHRSFAYWSVATGWTVDSGDHTVEIGASSRDIRASMRVGFDLPAVLAPLKADSTLAEWSAHPLGAPVLQGLFDQSGGTPAELQDPELALIIGAMPLAGVISISAGVDGHSVVAQLLAAVDRLQDPPQ
jgi:beta-glucosidase